MNSKTASVVIPVGKKKVFSYLSDIENLPKWATEFAQELKSVDGSRGYSVIRSCPQMTPHLYNGDYPFEGQLCADGGKRGIVTL